MTTPGKAPSPPKPPAPGALGARAAAPRPGPPRPAAPRPAAQAAGNEQRAPEPSAPSIDVGASASIDLDPDATPGTAAAAVAELSRARSSDGVRQISDPELQAAIDSMPRSVSRLTDPEASLDIPPPSRIEPLEDREPGAKDPYIGTTFDHRYKIQKLLGEGGMGFVYLARHKVIDKKVAVKVLRSDLARDREILERFLQEAKAASSIGNPHIVDISDFGDLPDGSTYFVMEHLDGRSLSDLIDSGEQISAERITHIALQIADGLSAAHAQGIVHRDLKPDNIFLIQRSGDPDFVKILDFGIAKVTGDSNTKLTKAGAVFGTPHYMSPEQAAGAPVDHRTDIYALGVMLYEMASGQLPFTADNFMGILTQHMYKAPVPPRALVPAPDCPPGLEAIILKCMSKKTEARYQSMDELAADLKRLESGGIPNAVAEMMERSGGFNVPHDYFKSPSSPAIVPTTPSEPQPSPRRGPYIWVAVAAAAVGIVATIIVAGGKGSGKGAAQTNQAETTTAVVNTAVPLPSPSMSAAPSPKKVTVVIAATPDTATGYRDNKPFKLPSSIEVEEGGTVSIEIRADGYETAKLELDGSESSKNVKLKPLTKVVGTKPNATGNKPSGTQNGGDVVDPWADKNKDKNKKP